MKKERESNYELMRIISMLFIVVYHMLIVTGGQLINHTSGFTQMFLKLLSLIIIVHVNSFVLLTGYFQYNKKTSMKKVVHLAGMALFYSIIIAIIFKVANWQKITFLDWAEIVSPLEFPNLWFLVIYLALYLLAPYINILIEKLNQTEHRKFIILLFVMFCIIPTMTAQKTFANTGFTLTHFIFLYILGAYLKKYPIKENTHFKNYSDAKKFIIFFSVFISFGIVNYLILYISESILLANPGNFMTYICEAINKNAYYYENPLIIIQSISYFLMFETFKFKSKIINYISSSIFAVYVITENPMILGKMYYFLKINTYEGKIFNGFDIILKMFFVSLCVFAACITIESLRKLAIKVTHKWLNKKKWLITTL